MKKQTVTFILSFVLASSLTASEGERGEYFFRSTFQKKLKRVKPVGLHAFKSLSLKQRHKKQEVFIDWRKLYWGKLSDITYSAEGPCDDGVQEGSGRGEQTTSSIDTEESQSFAQELRQELKSFARQYGLKIVWRKKSLGITDGTAAFLDYWDKGLSEEKQGKVVPFADLCASSVNDTNARDTRVNDTSVSGATIKDIRAKEIKNKGASTQSPPFTTMLFADFLCGYAPCEHVSLKKGA